MEPETIENNGASSKSHTSRMNILRRACFGLVVAGIVVSLSMELSACSNASAADSGGNINAPIQWEYKTIKVNSSSEVEQSLNAAGRQGWEFVGNLDGLNSNVLVLKRRLP
jgi:hypothetical protein